MRAKGLNLRSVIVSLLGLAAVAALLWVTFRPDPVPVDLSTVTRGPMQVTIDADGKTRVRDLYEIAAPIAGVARRSPVAVGDAVTGGETVVAVVEPVVPGLLDARTRMQAEAQVSEAEASLHVAETDLRRTEEERARAQSEYDRAQALVERGVSSLTRLEDAAERLAVATASVEAAQARIDMARGSLSRARAALVEPGSPDASVGACCVALRAPVDGVVLDIDVISARPVAMGARLATIGDPQDLEIVADLLSTDAVRLDPGALAHVERWGGAMPLEARLRRIEPKARTDISALGIEEQRVDAIFDLTSPLAARPRLGDGFSVFLRIVEWQADSTLQVPLSATFRQGDGWATFVVENGVARLRPVTMGRSAAQVVQVLDGLAEGTRVVTHPSDELEDGSPVVER
ncbi:HlyD family efflux transporter periplasmic adaptor subunit [Maribius pontilimi]|uniref:HlyD family efflux transporter periplasmic adaptor subunit n=1 Tax=Palleronia pontilimi TaxID=1964209 RepID=A0A934IAU9_9RHOB|nr:HlyD family efflux transporter periplasmic adaptor subunit [Palleronia pontilimi]MBJ3763689.1 HlyD family efflux transporter periplasmic adaptor subunit [Palleronia pontilimi]